MNILEITCRRASLCLAPQKVSTALVDKCSILVASLAMNIWRKVYKPRKYQAVFLTQMNSPRSLKFTDLNYWYLAILYPRHLLSIDAYFRPNKLSSRPLRHGCHSKLALSFRDAVGKFPEYPDEDDGGSATIFKEKNPEELEKELKEKVSSICKFRAVHGHVLSAWRVLSRSLYRWRKPRYVAFKAYMYIVHSCFDDTETSEYKKNSEFKL